MNASSGRRLSDALATLMNRERLTLVQVMRAAKLARNTIEYILDGRTREPHRSTLRHLARGLATDPSTGVVDEAIRRDAERILNDAAGYTDTPMEESESLLELALYRRLQDLPKARAWVQVIDRFADRDVSELSSLTIPEEG